MKKVPHEGETVRWGSSAGKTEGKVEKIVTRTTRIAGHVARASEEAPQVVVKSGKTGRKAVHKPEALERA